MNVLSGFNYCICYRSDKKNVVTDVLSRKNEATSTQKEIRTQERTQTLLNLIRIEIAAMKNIENLNVTAEVVRENRESLTLAEKRQLTMTESDKWSLKNDLLLYKDRLVIPKDENNLRTRLLRQIHSQTITAHPDQMKTRALMIRLY